MTKPQRLQSSLRTMLMTQLHSISSLTNSLRSKTTWAKMSSILLHVLHVTNLVRVNFPCTYDVNLPTNEMIAEIKFRSLDDPPCTPDLESSTILDDEEHHIYQTPIPIKQQLLVFVPGVVRYLPCWLWLPSWGGWGSWVASWTATWVTPPCWMPSLS